MAVNTSFAATSEQTLTIAFLYNFLKFAEWPEGAIKSDTLTICITDNASLGEELEAIDGRSAQNKTVRVKRMELGANPSDCQLLFLSREEKPLHIREWLKTINHMPILLVGNSDNFLDLGGMIVLVNAGDRLHFEINLEPVKLAGLKLNAQLLKIARHIKGG